MIARVPLLQDFLKSEAAGGLALMFAALLALAAANSPLAPAYFAALHWPLGPLHLLHWINDGLMAVFFLLVGLEIKREMVEGELSTWRRRALPGMAALGGMIAPAAVYLAVTWHAPELHHGWAIPAATDIAFSLGVLALLGSRAPLSLKIFLTALAIVDDLGAVAIIALFYTAQISLPWLGLAAVTLAALVLLNRARVLRLWPYLLLGAALWVFTLKSGVHATVAGVALAFTIPLTRKGAGESPLARLEHALAGVTAFVIVPIFGFANAGVSLQGTGMAALLEPIPLGIAAGLFFGKQAGVFAAAWLTVRLKWSELPPGATWTGLYGVALLCGIGFTISLFIGALAFNTPHMQDAAKLGVLAGSLLSGVAGWAVIRMTGKGRA